MSDVNEDMLLSDGDSSDITDRRVTETGKSLTDRPHGPTAAAVSNVDQSDISQSLHAIKGDETVIQRSCHTAERETTVVINTGSKGRPSNAQNADATAVSSIRRSLCDRNLSTEAEELILRSWRGSTNKQYQSYLRKWEHYCSEQKVDPFAPPIELGVNFLASLCSQGLGYSGVSTARSALSSVITLPNGVSFGEHSLVKSLLKGVFQTKPSLPRHSSTWDADVVLQYLKTVAPAEKLSLRLISLKLVMLLASLSGQRCQTLVALDIDCLEINQSRCVFVINSLLKQSRPGFHLDPIVFKAYAPDRRLCVVTYLRQYLKQTAGLRQGETKLLLSYRKPHKPVSTDTVGRWIKSVLTASGLDASKFTAHSTRAASCSFAKAHGLSVDSIMKAGGWTRESTFQKYYHKTVSQAGIFGESVLADNDN